jgi:hypothetical protein
MVATIIVKINHGNSTGSKPIVISFPFAWQIMTCQRGPLLAYTSPAVAPEMMSEQSLKLVSDFSSHFNTALHAVIFKSCKYFQIW